MVDFLYSAVTSRSFRCVLLALAGGMVFCQPAASGPYLSSAHGNSTTGVDRNAMDAAGYVEGNCAHCHEQHASLGGAEPLPNTGGDAGPDIYELFGANHTNQTTNFCYKCHDNTTTVAKTAVINHNYSYRAGNYTGGGGLPDDILEEFSLTGGQTSVHNLDDIVTAINAQSWNYNSGSNPCAACHNPHAAQKDEKTVTRRYPVSRPSLHDATQNDVWGLWGETGEKMSNYVAPTLYKNPYYWGGSGGPNFEPDNAAAQNNGTTVTDYVTFCQDCHVNSMDSANLGASPAMTAINWATGDKHGQGTEGGYGADNFLSLHTVSPYATPGTSNVLSCTDCHEPHASQNTYLIREAVNGGYTYDGGTPATTYTTIAFTGATNDFGQLCRKCHVDDFAANWTTRGNGAPLANAWDYVHHEPTNPADVPYNINIFLGLCNQCHLASPAGGPVVGDPAACANCHGHGMTDAWAPVGATGRKTF